jgi:tripartite tricarboxylate transporter family receptor
VQGPRPSFQDCPGRPGLLHAALAVATIGKGGSPASTPRRRARLRGPLALFAHPSFAVNDVKELITYSKANPGKLSVGTAGVSTHHHLAAAWLNTAAKIDITHVPYCRSSCRLSRMSSGPSRLINSGAVYRLTPTQQVDFHAAFGLNRNAPSFIAGVGYSFRLDGLFARSR